MRGRYFVFVLLALLALENKASAQSLTFMPNTMPSGTPRSSRWQLSSFPPNRPVEVRCAGGTTTATSATEGTWNGPNSGPPDLVVCLAWEPVSMRGAVAALSLPGRLVLTLRGEPHSTIELEVNGEQLRQTMGERGTLQIPIRIPPGIDSYVVRARDRVGHTNEREELLNIPPLHRVLWFPLPNTPNGVPRWLLAVAERSGNLPVEPPPIATNGAPLRVERIAPGLFLVALAQRPPRAVRSVRLWLADDPEGILPNSRITAEIPHSMEPIAVPPVQPPPPLWTRSLGGLFSVHNNFGAGWFLGLRVRGGFHRQLVPAIRFGIVGEFGYQLASMGREGSNTQVHTFPFAARAEAAFQVGPVFFRAGLGAVVRWVFARVQENSSLMSESHTVSGGVSGTLGASTALGPGSIVFELLGESGGVTGPTLVGTVGGLGINLGYLFAL